MCPISYLIAGTLHSKTFNSQENIQVCDIQFPVKLSHITNKKKKHHNIKTIICKDQQKQTNTTFIGDLTLLIFELESVGSTVFTVE